MEASRKFKITISSGKSVIPQNPLKEGVYETQIVAIKVFYDHKGLSFQRQRQSYQTLQECQYINETKSLLSASLTFQTYSGQRVEKKPVIVMKYAHKSVLYWYVAIKCGKPFSAPACRNHIRRLIQGVRYLDHKGIGHRDLKIQNIVFSEEYHLKFIDFGHSEKSKDSNGNYIEYQCHSKNPGFGTSHYRAPEVISGGKFTLIEYDLYSLGIILFLLYTKTYPYEKINDKKHKLFVEDNQKYWQNVRREVRRKGVQIDDSFIELMNSFLSLDKSKRPTLEKLQKYEEDYSWFKGTESTDEELKIEMDRIFEKLQSVKDFQILEEVISEIRGHRQEQLTFY